MLEALNTGKSFERIYVKDTLHGDFEKEIRHHSKEMSIPLKKVPQIKLDKLSRMKNHQGVVAIVSPIQYQDVENVIPLIYEQGKDPNFLILDNIQDIGNIGAIARSCEILGCNCLILSGKNSALIGEDAIKASAGALFRLPVCRESSTFNLISKLRRHGLNVVAASQGADNSLHEISLKPPLALIMGSESTGLSREIEEKSDLCISIPQVGKTESLNVSVAAGIILYEILKQSKFDHEA